MTEATRGGTMVGGQAVATAGSSMTSGMSMLAAARGAMPQHCHDAKKPPETRRPPVDNLMPQIMSSSKIYVRAEKNCDPNDPGFEVNIRHNENDCEII